MIIDGPLPFKVRTPFNVERRRVSTKLVLPWFECKVSHAHNYELNIGKSGSIFTARRVCLARTTPSQDVCLSIRLSVTRRYPVKTVTRIFKLFSPFWFFHTKRYSDGNPLSTIFNVRGMKKLRFSTNISLHLQHDTRYSHSYYGRRIANRTQAFKW